MLTSGMRQWQLIKLMRAPKGFQGPLCTNTEPKGHKLNELCEQSLHAVRA